MMLKGFRQGSLFLYNSNKVVMGISNFFSNLFIKIAGSKLVKRQVTTVIGYLSGWIGALGFVAPELLSRWASDSEQILVAGILYGIGILIDAKRPATPVFIEKQ